MESALEDTTADVLVILDCCHAGLLCRPAHRGPSRCFQYIVACPETGRTKTACAESFTAALTWSLRQLADKPGFHSSELLAHITKEAPHFPKTQYPQIYGGRFEACEEYVYIAPTRAIDPEGSSPVGKYRDEQEMSEPTKAILDLRCYFDPPLNSFVVRNTARKLKGLMQRREIQCSRIKVLNRDPKYGQWAARRWQEAVAKTRLSHDSSRRKKRKMNTDILWPRQPPMHDQSIYTESPTKSPLADEMTSLLQNKPHQKASTISKPLRRMSA